MEERFECGLEFRASSECGVGGAKTAVVLGVQGCLGIAAERAARLLIIYERKFSNDGMRIASKREVLMSG